MAVAGVFAEANVGGDENIAFILDFGDGALNDTVFGKGRRADGVAVFIVRNPEEHHMVDAGVFDFFDGFAQHVHGVAVLAGHGVDGFLDLFPFGDEHGVHQFFGVDSCFPYEGADIFTGTKSARSVNHLV